MRIYMPVKCLRLLTYSKATHPITRLPVDEEARLRALRRSVVSELKDNATFHVLTHCLHVPRTHTKGRTACIVYQKSVMHIIIFILLRTSWRRRRMISMRISTKNPEENALKTELISAIPK